MTFTCYFQVAIKIIDKTQLNPTSLQKVSIKTARSMLKACISCMFKNTPPVIVVTGKCFVMVFLHAALRQCLVK